MFLTYESFIQYLQYEYDNGCNVLTPSNIDEICCQLNIIDRYQIREDFFLKILQGPESEQYINHLLNI